MKILLTLHQQRRNAFSSFKSALLNPYEEAHRKSIDPSTMEEFWAEHAKMIDWYKFPSKILDRSNAPFYSWFKDGLMNTSYNCIDRHLPTLGDKPAIIHESPLTNSSKSYSWKEMHDIVARFASVLIKHGINKGDRVIIYMPMIPEAIFAKLACARIGAIHSFVFGGFAAKELASRINDAKAKLIITASCGIEPNKIIDYKKIVDEAANIIGNFDIKKIVVQRPQLKAQLRKGVDFEFYDELAKSHLMDPVPLNGNDPLYILYTSGTTGNPKGVVRENAGNAVALSWAIKYITGLKKGDVFFAGSDFGWVVGHSFITYGPLLSGISTIVFEGKPVGTPDPGIIWKTIEKHKVNCLFTSPTALRSIRKEDSEGNYLKKSDFSTLKTVMIAGERLDIHTFEWISNLLPKHVLLNDNYWQTETGWPILSNYKNLYTFPNKPGSAVKPAVGYEPAIIDENGIQVNQHGKIGKLCLKLPMPPSFMATLYNNDKGFIEKYLSEVPGYFDTGDAAYFDDDGYYHLVARTDDMIKVAAHRLSTSQMEEILLSHSSVAEAATVAKEDDLKGEIPVGFVVLKNMENKPDLKKIEEELVKKVRNEIGAVACFKSCIILEKLPKTRSGKILRGLLKKLTNGEEYTINPTIEDASVILHIQEKIKEYGLNTKSHLEYDEGEKN